MAPNTGSDARVPAQTGPRSATATGLARVLLVDDEQALVDGLRRSLYGRFRVATAVGGEQAMTMIHEAVAEGDPYAVVVSDMRMPGMNGAQLLTLVRVASPDSVRMILSGQADLASTIEAVNEAGLFRFLNKPCGPADLTRALGDAVAQYRLVTAERELLERTVRDTADLLSDMLAMAAPQAYARTTRLRHLVDAARVDLRIDDWRLPIATTLSHLGCVGVPLKVVQAVESGVDLEGEEWAIWLGHPSAAAAMLSRTPRLEDVAQWIGRQPLTGGLPVESAEPAEMLFYAAVSMLSHSDKATSSGEAVARLRASRAYPSSIVDVLARHHHLLDPAAVRRRVSVRELRGGMTLEQDVLTVTGMTLVRKGESVSRTLALRLLSFADSIGVIEPIEVLQRGEGDPHWLDDHVPTAVETSGSGSVSGR